MKDKDEKSKPIGVSGWVYNSILIAIAIVVIYMFYPKQGRLKYEYQKGKPWQQNEVIASFDFPVMKSAEYLEAERDCLFNNYVPIFNYEPNVETRMIAKLENDLDELIISKIDISTEKRIEIEMFLTEELSQLYQVGILPNSIASYGGDMADKKEISKVYGKFAQRVKTTELNSLKSAHLKMSEAIADKAMNDQTYYAVRKNLEIDNYIAANLEYDKSLNDTKLNELLENISLSNGVVQSGTRIISRGEIVNDKNFMELESYNLALSKASSSGGWFSLNMLGNLTLILVLMATLLIYINNYNRSVFVRKRKLTMTFAMIAIFFIVTKLIHDAENISMLIIPFVMLPIIIRSFISGRMAIFVHLIFLLLVSGMADNSLEFVFTQMIPGVVAVVTLSKLNRRGNLFISSFLILLSYIIVTLGFALSKDGTLTLENISDIKLYVISSGLVWLSYLVNYLIEKTFGFVSDVTLVELSDTNTPLLRKLAEEAPGTFQHSMQVANLAEAVIVQTSGNTMLVRAGALYHDIGKIANPQYFIENLEKGKNPHEKLDHFESAKTIIRHVTDGVALAKKYNLPEPIVEFIKTHHGTSLVKYFYLKHKEENPDTEVNELDFKYPGPNPQSRETAILMLADGVEAAARSLPDKNEESLKKVIDMIVDGKVQNHELDDAPITFSDIKIAKAIFLEKLKNIYHVRIEYPKEKK